jgi:uncharacterized protein
VPLVLDTGPIYSSIDRSDPDHQAVVELLRSTPRPHIVAEPVLVEVDYWIRKLLDVSALDAFVSDIVAGRYELVTLDGDDLVRVVELESRYADADLGFVDASIVAICERLDIAAVATFDHRDFGMIRPRHCRHLELVP